jgi:hypothetical protein
LEAVNDIDHFGGYHCPHDAAHRMTGPELLRSVEKEHG